MKRAIALGIAGAEVSVDDIRDIHRTLLRFSVDREIAGVVRKEQNWIGGNDFNPIGAAYVPLHQSMWSRCSTISAGSSRVTILRRSPRRRSFTPSSRTSTAAMRLSVS